MMDWSMQMTIIDPMGILFFLTENHETICNEKTIIILMKHAETMDIPFNHLFTLH